MAKKKKTNWWVSIGAAIAALTAIVTNFNQITDGIEKAAIRVGIIKPKESKRIDYLCYQIGRRLITYATYMEVKQKTGSLPNDLQVKLESIQSELDGELKSLSLSIEYRKLDYSSASDNLEHSAGVMGVADLIETTFDRKARDAFELGASLENVTYRALMKKYVWPLDSQASGYLLGPEDAFLALSVLNENAKSFGVEEVPSNELDGNDKESFNQKLKLLAEQLSGRVETKLRQ